VYPRLALLLHARLLAGDPETAYRSVAARSVLGWSSTSSDQALAVFVLPGLAFWPSGGCTAAEPGRPLVAKRAGGARPCAPTCPAAGVVYAEHLAPRGEAPRPCRERLAA